MSERVTRDGDTVTVQCAVTPDDVLQITPVRNHIGQWEIEVEEDIRSKSGCFASIFTDKSTLAALGGACHALAGEPDWRAEVEALRARCQRLIAELAYQMPECPTFQYIEPNDMDDDLSQDS